MHARTLGLTLIELLIAASIGLVVLTLTTNQIMTGASAASVVINNQQLLEDLRAAGNYTADMTSNAAWVFPEGAKLKIGSSNGYTTRNPATGKNEWEVGEHPVLAMLLPPSSLSGNCDTTPAACARFVAFYTLERAHVTDNATGAENPGADPSNPDALALYVYTENLDQSSVWEIVNGMSVAGTLNDASFTANSGNLLADYIAPDGFTITYTHCFLNGSPLNEIKTGSPCTELHSVSRLAFGLQAAVKRGARTITAPAAPLRFNAATRNTIEP